MGLSTPPIELALINIFVVPMEVGNSELDTH